MERTPHYGRVLLKVSGEALAKPMPLLVELMNYRDEIGKSLGEFEGNSNVKEQLVYQYKRLTKMITNHMSSSKFSIDMDFVNKLTAAIAILQKKYGIKFGIVPGGGNFWRGAKHDEIVRDHSDQIGMLATLMNAKAIFSSFEKQGVPSRVFSAHEVRYFAEPYVYDRLEKKLSEDKIAIFAEGTGLPRFTTDTGAVTRACEMSADVVFKLTDVPYLYTADPKKDKDAKPYLQIPYSKAVKLGAMDGTAIELAQANDMPIRLFSIENPEETIEKALFDEAGTYVGPDVKRISYVKNQGK